MKILVVTGASGGHIFPALAFLDTLKEKYKNIETLLVLPLSLVQRRDLPKAGITNQIGIADYKVNYIFVSTIKLRLDFKNFAAILIFLKSFLKSVFILLEFRPDIVVGFGGLPSVPLIIFAWLFRIKNLIHEQNVIPGRANRFLMKFTDRIAVSFVETKDYFRNCQTKIVLTGNPVRKELIRIDRDKALDFFGFNDSKFTILVMGGSQGSHRINLGFLKTISNISDRNKFQVIHLTGAGDYDLLKQGYSNLNVDSRLFGFLKDMQYAYSASDLVLSRGGATTIAEIISFRLPAVIVPYPYAYKHQLSNAKVLEKNGSAFIIEDDTLDTDILRHTIEGIINNPDKIKAMRMSYDYFSNVDANALFVNEVLSLEAA